MHACVFCNSGYPSHAGPVIIESEEIAKIWTLTGSDMLDDDMVRWVFDLCGLFL